uniref:Uncharacterized protein n=1 Tax=Siphoviridae sp. ct7aK2 TaxID=2825351 RepID=A0A8S5U9D9_9CAUD|nr:MAG TPA: hypothetical protein [Siphoviridae sp. ct7aK2]
MVFVINVCLCICMYVCMCVLLHTISELRYFVEKYKGWN